MKIQNEFYSITPYGNLLYIETFAAWDERVSRSYLEDVTSLALKLYRNKPWAILVDRRNWGLHTPEAARLFAERGQEEFKTPLSCIAVVTGHSEVKKWQMGCITESAKAIKIKLFKDLDEAKEWLSSSGFPMISLGTGQ